MDCNQFDATIGGKEHLPFSAHSLQFATSRSIEIAAMTENILERCCTKLVFQTLPVHMRRRVMSHNFKRLPIKYRKAHIDQMKKSGNAPQHRPSRKHRRRPGNLLDEYNRRKKNNIWLETHIWHAKRFHMIERWGYKIAYASCDKAFRACYRATSAHCLMQDISYYVQIQIAGSIHLIKDMFQNITSSLCNLGVCAKAYTSGSREGSIHIYKPNMYPFGYIGKVSYLWEPGEGANRRLWLFVHPSIATEVKDMFMEVTEMRNDNFGIPQKKQKMDKVCVNFLDNTYNIFRLTGPNAHAILSKSLQCIENVEQIKSNNWVETYSTSFKTDLQLTEKFKYWENIKHVDSPSQLPSRMVAGLIIRDPRLMRPVQRTKAVNSNNDSICSEYLCDVPNYSATSPLWNQEILETIKNNRLTNTEFIEHVTTSQLIPGTVFIEDPKLQSVPVVILQKPGSQDSSYKKVGYGSGWDVIVPPGYGLQFWQTFIMFGARSGGLRESESLAFEMGECYMPPDSKAGFNEEMRIEKELRDRYFKLPPSKRVNYIKLGIVSPFVCLWKILLSDWSGRTIDDFYVLRDKRLLAKVQDCFNNKLKLPPVENSDSCLIPIYIQIDGKGSLRKHALICLPKTGDFNIINTLQEPLHEDDNESKRKELRKEHRQSIKRIRRKKNKNRVKMNGNAVETKRKTKKGEPSEYVKKMRELWIPPKVEHVRDTNSRELLGYLTSAAFSFTEAHSCGVGYIPYNALRALIDSKEKCLLIRNVSSKKYRKANFKIIS